MVNTEALQKCLSSIGWTMERLETVLDGGIEAVSKSTIWDLIKPDAFDARLEVARVRAVFPQAKIIRITSI